MASVTLDGSPTPRKRASFTVHEDAAKPEVTHGSGDLHGLKRENSADKTDLPMPLTTSKLANQMPQNLTRKASSKKIDMPIPSINVDPTDRLGHSHIYSPMDELLVKLSEQQALLTKQKQTLNARHASQSSGSSSYHPESDPPSEYATSRHESVAFTENGPDPVELFRLKKELEMAQSRIARMDQELSQSRITKHTLEQAMGPQFDNDFDHARSFGLKEANTPEPWFNSPELGPSAIPAAINDGRPQGIWSADPGMMQNRPFAPPFPINFGNDLMGGGMPLNGLRSTSPNVSAGQYQRPQQPALRLNTSGMGPFYSHDPSPAESLRREGSLSSRPSSAFGNHLQAWGPFNAGTMQSEQTTYTPPLTPLSFQMQQAGPPMQMHHMGGPQGPAPYMPRPIGTRLSPTAAEFSAGHNGNGYAGPTPWNTQPPSESAANYLSNAEPTNYRRLLDRNMTCNWKYIVDKIVCSNDQQASIFLQQKLKVGTHDQKFEIVQAIIDQAYPLMINRFGNFLVQRCFEHGTPEQVISIARAIRGNTLNLSMDAFGCHVVQKAFDCVPEEYKAIMVHELLRRIPETVIHRYACHVWQKLFELRWSDSPPQIMKYVNEALRGMWHEVALGETGSLVVQNIFENCLEEDKRPCINEVLASIDVVAHGQFGNWCIQHICEHGSIPDRTRATDHVLRFATEYSMDQFASKVIEKCLKIGGSEFLDRYLDRVCEARPDRPRMPLIDVAGDQFGNYLIQYILTHADPPRCEVVAAHIRKHMVSLRGSKYGSRVAMLCCNPAFATRPGPPAGGPMGRGSGVYPDRPGYTERPYGGGSRPAHYGSGYC